MFYLPNSPLSETYPRLSPWIAPGWVLRIISRRPIPSVPVVPCVPSRIVWGG